MDHPHLEVRDTRRLGMGVFATGNFRAGEKVAAFDGPVYEFQHEFKSMPGDPPLDIELRSIPFHPLKSRDSKGVARLLNHSCNPNCGVVGLFQITAMRDIETGEELTWDYDMAQDDEVWYMKCTCNRSICRGVIAGYRFLPPERRAAYEGYISAWLLEEERPYLGPAVEFAKQSAYSLDQDQGISRK